MGILLLVAALAAPSLQAEMQVVETGRSATTRTGDSRWRLVPLHSDLASQQSPC